MLLRIIQIPLLAILLMSCYAVRTTNKVKNEKTIAKIHEAKPELLAYEQMKPQAVAGRGELTSMIAGTGIGMVADGVKKLIDLDAKKYNAEYTAAITENYFYNQLSTIGPLDPHGIQFNGVHATRLFGDNKKRLDTAFYISLKVDQNEPYPYDLVNNSLMRLKLEKLILPYAKCKVPESRWFLPWTWFLKKTDSLNLDVTVSIKSSWMTRQGVYYDKIEVGKFLIQFPKFPIERSKQDNYVKLIKEGEKKGRLDGYLMLVPRSFGYFYSSDGLKECWGQGLYSITVDVKESAKENFVTKVVEETALPSWIDTGAGKAKTRIK